MSNKRIEEFLDEKASRWSTPSHMMSEDPRSSMLATSAHSAATSRVKGGAQTTSHARRERGESHHHREGQRVVKAEREKGKSSSETSNDTLGAQNFDELRQLDQGRNIGEFDWWGLSSKSSWVRIGKGGYGSVYKAKWYGKTVAIKEARANSKGSAKRALEREVEHLSKLHHPNVIHVFGCFHRKNSTYLVMEYVPHCLRDEWTACRVDMPRIMLQIARALLFLHRKGIVHRDVKTRNICITADYKVAKLIDFGLAASLHSSTKELTRKVGTKKYRAPEVNGTVVQGFGVDIYSYGAMLMRICSDFNDMSSDMSAVTSMLHPLAQMCIDDNPYARPTSYEVLKYLHQCVNRRMEMKENFTNGMIAELQKHCLGLGGHLDSRITDVRITDEPTRSSGGGNHGANNSQQTSSQQQQQQQHRPPSSSVMKEEEKKKEDKSSTQVPLPASKKMKADVAQSFT